MAKQKRQNLTVEKTAKKPGGYASMLSAGYDPGGFYDDPGTGTMGRWENTPDQRRMIEEDTQVRACLLVRRNALLGTPATVTAADGYEIADDVIDDCRVALRRIENLRDVLGGMLSASVPYGHSVAEVIWTVDPATGRYYPDAIKVRKGHCVWVNDDDAIMAKDESHVPKALDEAGEYAMKMLVMTHDSSDGTRRGCGLAASLWYPVWGKAENTKSWLIHNDKYGMPILEGITANGTPDADKLAIKRVLARAVNQSVIVHDAEHQVKFLDANNYQSTQTFRELTSHLENQIAKLILGQTMTTGDINSNGSGSYAIGKVGQDVFESIVRADACMVESVVTQLLRWFVALNYGDGPAAGIEYKYQLETVDLTADEFANVAQKLSGAGIKLDIDADYVRTKVGMPAPREGGEAVSIGMASAPQQGALPPDDGGGFRQFSDLLAPDPVRPKTVPVHLQGHAEKRATATRSIAESVFGQMTDVLNADTDPAEKARQIESFRVKPTDQARAFAREIASAVFVGLAVGSLAPALAKDRRHRFEDDAVRVATGIANEAQTSGLLGVASGAYVRPDEAINYLQTVNLPQSMRLNQYIEAANTWGRTSVVNTQYAAQETVKVLLAKQVGAEYLGSAQEIESALGKVDFRQFMQDWEQVGLPSLAVDQTFLIFNQNIQTAFSAGRWVGMDVDAHRQSVAGLRYVSMLLPTTRPDHAQWHGTVHPMESPFWDTHYPPNGFNCLCDVIAVYDWDKAELTQARKAGKFYPSIEAQLPTYTTKSGVTYDFNFNPGRQLQRGQISGLAT